LFVVCYLQTLLRSLIRCLFVTVARVVVVCFVCCVVCVVVTFPFPLLRLLRLLLLFVALIVGGCYVPRSFTHVTFVVVCSFRSLLLLLFVPRCRFCSFAFRYVCWLFAPFVPRCCSRCRTFVVVYVVRSTTLRCYVCSLFVVTFVFVVYSLRVCSFRSFAF
jgi:hypothetical protein